MGEYNFMLNAVALLNAALLLGQSIQSPLEPFFVQSWKSGVTQIEEKQLEVQVTKANPSPFE